MAVSLSFLLILPLISGSESVKTITKVSVKMGASVSIPCSYDLKYKNHVKYLCKGFYWDSCSYEIRTDSPWETGKYSISDDKTQRIFTVTMKQLISDSYYWCIVEIKNGADEGQLFQLSVTKGKPILWVADQNVIGYIGDKININFYYATSGGIQWCKLGRTCVTQETGKIDGTAVTINKAADNVCSVTMSGLKQEDSGWYYCVKGDFQMPVHLTVTVKPTVVDLRTTTETIKVTESPAATRSTDPGLGEIPNPRSSVDQNIHIITLGLLSLVVLVALLMWFIQRCKNTKEDLTDPKSNKWEIVFTAVSFKLKSTPQSEANEEYVTYSTVVYQNQNI